METLLVGEHPPRLRAPAEEDPFHPDFVTHPERWVGAEPAHQARNKANMRTAVEMTLEYPGSRIPLGGKATVSPWPE